MRSQQSVKKWLWYTGQNLLDNPMVARYVDARTVSRQDLSSGHPSVSDSERFDDGETIRFDAPVSVGALPGSIGTRPRKVAIDESVIWELKGTQLVGPNALTLTRENEFVAENALGYRKRIEMGTMRSLFSGTIPRQRPTDKTYQVAISLVGPWCRNYYHWLLDYLARLRHVEDYSCDRGLSPIILIPSNPTNWMLECLELAGVKQETLECWDDGRTEVERLILPSLARNTDVPGTNPEIYGTSPAALQWLRQRFLNCITPIDDVDRPTRIYVSRESATERRVRNRNDLEEVLSEYGFASISPADYSVAEQVSMFAEAEAVVGPTGAGLVNAIFGEDLSLVVLFGSDTHPVYYAIGELLGFDTGVVQCEPVDCDLVVEPDDLRQVFDELGL
jgi:hypothetical protein